MAVTSHVYPLAVQAINDGTIDLNSDTFKALLCTGDASAWTATEEAFQFVDDITGAYTEVTDGDYARVTLVSPALSRSGAKVKWAVTTPISWGSAVTITARSMAVFDSSIGSSVDGATPVICIVDFGANVSSTAGTWEYNLDGTNGLAAWTSS